MNSERHQGAFFFGMIIGIMIGAIGALFMTPKSGRQLRHEMKDQAGGVQQLVTDVTLSMRDRSEGFVGGAVDKVTQLTQRDREDEVVVVSERMPVNAEADVQATSMATDEPDEEPAANPS